MFTTKYDKINPNDIERHGKQLEGHCLKDYLDFCGKACPITIAGNKGKLGQLVEEVLFEKKLDSKKEADFKEARVELKVTPLKPKGSTLTIKERLVLSVINFNDIVSEKWENNSLFTKLEIILLMFYLHEDKPSIELIFKLVSLWKPSDNDLVIIKNDWNLIVDKIKSGKAHELSEADTNYLGACPKGANSQDTVNQPFSDIQAMRRAFSLKSSYMRFVYQSLLEQQEQLISITHDGNFENKIKSLFSPYIGKPLSSFIAENHLETQRNSKQFNKDIIEEFLKNKLGGISVQLEEFQKANITLKTIVLQKNDKPRESMSFKQIQYKEIINEEWDDFEINKIHQDGRFLWVVMKALKPYTKQSDLALEDIVIEKVMFWGMPYEDLQVYYKSLWEDTKQKIIKGDYKNFLGAKNNPVGHIRPKARNSKDLMETPQGTFEKKKCFWINADYIAKQIKNAE